MGQDNSDIATIILAGGYSKRMGAFKPLLKIEDRPAVDILVRSFADAGAGRIVIVTGHEHEKLERHIKDEWTDIAFPHVITAFNENYSKGMFSSVQKGITCLKETVCGDESISGTFMIPVDCSVVSSETIRILMDAIEKSEDNTSFFVPAFKGKKGHPLYIPELYWQEIIDYNGEYGVKGITEKYPDRMKKISVNDEGALMDMDDPAGYKAIKEYYTNK